MSATVTMAANGGIAPSNGTTKKNKKNKNKQKLQDVNGLLEERKPEVVVPPVSTVASKNKKKKKNKNKKPTEDAKEKPPLEVEPVIEAPVVQQVAESREEDEDEEAVNYEDEEEDDDEDDDDDDDDYDLEAHELFIKPPNRVFAQPFMKPPIAQPVHITKRIESPEPSATFVKKFAGDDCELVEDGKPDAEVGEKPGGCDVGSDNEEQEDVGDYCKGGYHPVKIGDLYNQR